MTATSTIIKAFEGLSQITREPMMLVASETRALATRSRIVSVNTECEKLFQFTAARLFNQSFHQLIDADENVINDEWQNYNFELQAPWQGKFNLRTKTTHITNAEIAASKFGQDHQENFYILKFTAPSTNVVDQAISPAPNFDAAVAPIFSNETGSSPLSTAPAQMSIASWPIESNVGAIQSPPIRDQLSQPEHGVINKLEHLESVLKLVPAGIFRLNYDPESQELRYISSNDRHDEMVGYSNSQISGKTPTELLPADQSARLTQKYLQAAQSGKSVVYEEYLQVPSGHKWFQTIVVPIPSQDGIIRELVGVSHDVTDRKNTANALAEKIDQQAAIAELGQLAMSNLELNSLLQQAAAIVAEALNLGYCKIQEYNNSEQQFVLRAGIGWQPDLIGNYVSHMWDNTMAAAAIKSLNPIVINDFDAQNTFVRSNLLKMHGINSGLAIAIMGLNGPYGVISVHSQNPHHFDDDQIHFLQVAADTLANSVKNHLSEQALRDSERLVSSILEAAQIGIGVSDESGRFVRVNPAFCKIFGYDSKDILGREFTILLPFAEHQRARAIYAEFMKTGLEMPGEGTCLRSDGRPVDVQITAGRLQRADGSMLRVTTVEDITLRKQIENNLKLFQLAALNSHDGVIITEPGPADNPGPKVIFCNQASAHITGYARNEILGRPITMFQGPETEDEKALEIQSNLRQRKPSDVEIILHRKDGSPYWAQTTMVPVTDSLGRHMNWLFTFRDISERKENERLLQIAKEQAITASEAKSDFLAGVSHEIRTPLNAIIGFADVLRRELFGPLGHDRYRSYAEDIHDSGRHLLQLINNTLDLSKIEAGVLELHESEIPMDAVIRSGVALMRDSAQNAKIELTVDLPEQSPYLRGDETKVKQILLNMLSNAIKYTLPGGKVTARCFIDPRGLILQVEDTGVGIPKSELPKVMQKYMQVSNEQNKHQQGTGLGIPVTKSLVELHGGKLDLQSEEGIGTVISAIFPSERIVQGQTRPFPSHKLAS